MWSLFILPVVSFVAIVMKPSGGLLWNTGLTSRYTIHVLQDVAGVIVYTLFLHIWLEPTCLHYCCINPLWFYCYQVFGNTDG